ncbi:MAG: hypothetical protein AB7O38_06295 [Pirellulaceae bacterium]
MNAITAVDEANAKAIHAALAKIKPYPFCARKGHAVIEYVGRNIDNALAIKTSYELGLLAKPDAVHYRVTAELATVEKADYMACNMLFNQFLRLQSGTNQNAIQQINDLSKRLTFGSMLVLRNPSLDGISGKHTFEPPAVGSEVSEARIGYAFGEVMTRANVPFVTATMELTVDNSGFRTAVAVPPAQLTAPTPFWPAGDPTVAALARRITAG